MSLDFYTIMLFNNARMFSSILDSSILIERVSAFKNNNQILIFYYIFPSLIFIQPSGVPWVYF
jgi:hypothetical protein